MAIQYGKCFEDYHPLFLEEPAQAENPRAMARIARARELARRAGDPAAVHRADAIGDREVARHAAALRELGLRDDVEEGL